MIAGGAIYFNDAHKGIGIAPPTSGYWVSLLQSYKGNVVGNNEHFASALPSIMDFVHYTQDYLEDAPQVFAEFDCKNDKCSSINIISSRFENNTASKNCYLFNW